MFDFIEDFWSWLVEGKLVQSTWIHHTDDNEVRDLLLDARRNVDVDVPVSISGGDGLVCESDEGDRRYDVEPSQFLMVHHYDVGLRFWAQPLKVVSYRLEPKGEHDGI